MLDVKGEALLVGEGEEVRRVPDLVDVVELLGETERVFEV